MNILYHLLKCTRFQTHSVSKIKGWTAVEESEALGFWQGERVMINILSACHMLSTVISAVHMLPHLSLWSFFFSSFIWIS